MNDKILWVVLAVILLLGLVYHFSSSSGGDLPTGAPIPEVSMTDIQGNTFETGRMRGRVVMVNFWATWCPPCRAEIPALVRLHEKYAEEGLFLIGISVDRDGDEKVVPFVRENKVTYPIVTQNSPRLAEEFGLGGAIPTTMVFGREGRLRKTIVGSRSYGKFEEVVTSLLEEEAGGEEGDAAGQTDEE